MILASDAVNAQQMLLLKKGVCLTAENLRMLKSWGVAHLYVESPGHDDEEDFRAPATIIDLEQEILSRLTVPDGNPIVSEICRVAAEIIHERAILKE
jgi:hypothetical protein